MSVQVGERSINLAGDSLVLSRKRTFSPSDIPGLQLWLDAVDCASVGDGNAITNWVDRIAGYTFTQPTSTLRPLYRATSNLGSQPAVEFDGIDDRMTLVTAPLTNTAGTIIIVGRFDAIGTDQYYASADTSVTTRFMRFGSITPNACAQIRQRNADTADNLFGNTVLVANTKYVLMYGSTGTAYKMEVNGVAQTFTINTGADNGDWYGDTTRTNMTVGCGVTTTAIEFTDGLIGEILDYSRDLTATELDLIYAYLGAKYTITIS